MDNTENIVTTVEWFAGYAGNSMGLRQVIPNLRDIAFCEREGFACANLVAKMEQGLLDAAPIWTDCRTFPCEEFHGLVDIFIASYPCTPFSAAGKRAGANDERHLWPYVRQFVQRARPEYVFLENVEGHITLGLSTVISDLAEDGYTAAWGIFSASEVGAPQQRKRVFILAYATEWKSREPQTGNRREGVGGGSSERNGPVARSGYCEIWPARPGEQQYEWEPPRVVAHDNDCGHRGRTGFGAGDNSSQTYSKTPVSSGRSADREAKQMEAISEVDRVPHGPSARLDKSGLPGECNTELADISGWETRHTNRIDELRMCGNGVVPATAAKAFVTLYNELMGE